MRIYPLTLFLTALGVINILANTARAEETLRVYIGTYTRGASEGIYFSDMDLADGSLTPPKLAAKASNPSFLAIHPNGKRIYAVNEDSNFRGERAGSVCGFDFQADGTLELINQESTVGPGPCHLVVDQTGRNVLVANYGGGSVCVLPISADGHLQPASTFIQHIGSSVTARQRGPHAHSINLDAANRFAFVADLGLDRVLQYAFDAETGKLVPAAKPFVQLTPGSGPRHFVFHPEGRFAWVINEMTRTVTAFSYDASTGSLTRVQTVSTVPGGFAAGSTAEIRVHPSGRFLYGSNRGHDSIAVFKIDQSTGRLTRIQNQSTLGQTPRNFNLTPNGSFLLAENQKTHSVVVFRVDSESGALTETGHQIQVDSPVCIRMLKL